MSASMVAILHTESSMLVGQCSLSTTIVLGLTRRYDAFIPVFYREAPRIEVKRFDLTLWRKKR